MKFTDLKDKILSSNLFLFIAILILISAVLSVMNASYRGKLLREEIKNLEAELLKIDEDNKRIEGEIEKYKTPEFLEQEARRRFNLKKEGEEVIIIPK